MDENTIGLSRDMKIPFTCTELWEGKKGGLEIKYDSVSNRWYAYIPIEVEWKTSTNQKTLKAALDLGICNLATLTIESIPKQIIWSGRQVLADWQYWTKRIAAHQQALCYSKKWKSRELLRLYQIRRRGFKHAVNAMLRQVFETLEACGIGLYT